MRGAECHPWLAELEIVGLFHGKPGRFSAWREIIADIVGAPIEYRSTRHGFAIPNTLPNPPQTLEFIEANVTDPTWLVEGRASYRKGIWDATPEEPLWIVLLATVPGATFFAHHAGAIAQRLEEIDELVHYVGKGGVTSFHENACRCFAEQAKTGQDMTMSGGYEPTGWWSPDLEV